MTNHEVERLKNSILSMYVDVYDEYDRYYNKALYDVIGKIEEITQSGWIPVSVQEPDVGGIYLVTAKDISGHIGVDLARRVSDNVWTFGGEEIKGTEIIAWQPFLLKPYKEAENEENSL